MLKKHQAFITKKTRLNIQNNDQQPKFNHPKTNIKFQMFAKQQSNKYNSSFSPFAQNKYIAQKNPKTKTQKLATFIAKQNQLSQCLSQTSILQKQVQNVKEKQLINEKISPKQATDKVGWRFFEGICEPIPQSLNNIPNNNQAKLCRINTIHTFNSIRYEADNEPNINEFYYQTMKNENDFDNSDNINKHELMQRVIQLEKLVSGIISGKIKIQKSYSQQTMIKMPNHPRLNRIQSDNHEKKLIKRSKTLKGTDHKLASNIKSTKRTRNQIEVDKRQPLRLDNKAVTSILSKKKKNVLRITNAFKSKIQKKNEQQTKKEQIDIPPQQQQTCYEIR